MQVISALGRVLITAETVGCLVGHKGMVSPLPVFLVLLTAYMVPQFLDLMAELVENYLVS